MRTLIAVVLLGMLASVSYAQSKAFVVAGYVPEWRVEQIDPKWGDVVTDLIYFSAEPKPTGELDASRLDPKGLEKLQAIKQQQKVKILFSIGGWGRSDGFAAMSIDPAARAKFIQEVTEYCVKNKLDGVDLDWEHPRGEAQEKACAELFVELKKSIAPYGMILTSAMAPWQNLSREAFDAIDRVHVMAYDDRGRHSTFEYAQESIESFEKKGVSRDRLVLGVPFYGRKINPPRDEATYADILAKAGGKLAADVDESDGFYFNGPATIRRKTEFAKQQKLAGVMIWEIAQDAPGDASLLKTIGDSIKP
jgi:chitinase